MTRTLLRAFLLLGLLGSSANAMEPQEGDPFLEEYYAILDAKDPPPTADPMLEEYQTLARSNRLGRSTNNTRSSRSLPTERSAGQWRQIHSRSLSTPSLNTPSSPSNLLQSASPSAQSQSSSLLAQGAGIGAAPVHGGFGAYTQRSEHLHPNLSIGPLDLAITWTTMIESSDNFAHTSAAAQDSLSLSGGFLIDGQLSLSERQTISLSLGLGADYWLDGPDTDVPTGSLDVNIVPGSSISYNIAVGDHIAIRLYDQLQIQRNRQRNAFSLDPRSVSDQWMNAAGTLIQWSISESLTLEAGYEFGQRHAMDNQFADNDYDWQAASLRLSLSDNATFATGIESRASWSDYDSRDRSDANSVSLGAFAQWTPTEYTSFIANGGIERWRFKDSTTLPGNSQSLFYGSLGISNQLNEDFRQTLSIGRNSSLSDFANLSRATYVRYGFDWDLTPGTRLNSYFAFEQSEETGSGRNEKLDGKKVGLNLQQSVGEYVSVGLGAHYSGYDSNLDDRSYAEQRGQAWMSWHVNQALTLTASYEHWRATGDVDFQENRFLFGSSLSF